MAEEFFIGELDSKRIKAAIYQTKFWPQYRRDKVYTTGTSHTSASGSNHGSSSSAFHGTNTGATFFQPNDWFGGMQPDGRSQGSSSGHGTMTTSGYSESESFGDSESVADIPIFVPVPFEELSSVQYYTPEEQLIELTAALKEQFPRHCFIKIHGRKTQPLLVPFVEEVKSFRTSQENLAWYRQWQMQKQHALSAVEVDRVIEARKAAFRQEVVDRDVNTIDLRAEIEDDPRTLEAEPPALPAPLKPKSNLIWNRISTDTPGEDNPTARLTITGLSDSERKRRAKSQQR